MPFVDLDRLKTEIQEFGKTEFRTEQLRVFIENHHSRPGFFLHGDHHRSPGAGNEGVLGGLRALRRIGFLDYDPRRGYWVRIEI